jgi:RHS repeat-associated protein
LFAVYERTNGTTLTWKEQDLYGSSRLGMQKPEKVVTGYLYYDCPNGYYGSWTKSGAKSYELSNHLGNVMAVISDRGELQSAQDFFPFGMAMPGRSSGSYRYTFNGKETDPETGLNDFGARLYDNRLGRWLALDPLAKKYPELTPYNFVANNPLFFVDPDGKRILIYYQEDGRTKVAEYKPFADPPVNNRFVQDFFNAANNLAMKNKESAVALTTLSKSNKVITVDEYVDNSPNLYVHNDSYDSKEANSTENPYGQISWQPNTSFKTKNGIVRSSTLELSNLIDYAWADLIAPASVKARNENKNAQYGNEETKRVITGSEQKVAKILEIIKPGGVTRTNNEKGACVPSSVPKCEGYNNFSTQEKPTEKPSPVKE